MVLLLDVGSADSHAGVAEEAALNATQSTPVVSDDDDMKT
jgi:hypothetical protein